VVAGSGVGVRIGPDPVIDSARAWLSAVAVAVANGIGFGIAYTFGTFFDSMATEFDADRGPTALIFGLTLLFFFGFGVVSGPLADRFGPRPLLLVGALTMVLGLLATSRAGSLPVAIVSYGVGVGIGGGLFVTPMTSSVGPLFERRRPAAFSLVAVGNGIGVLVLVPLSERIIDAEGWRTAYVALAAVAAFGLGAAALALVSPAGGPGTPRASVRSLVAVPGFPALFAVSLLMSVALFIAFAFIQPFATDDGVSVPDAARLISLVGLASVVGRLGLMVLVRGMGPVWLIRLTLVMQLVAYAVWYVAGGRLGLLALFAGLLGISYGGFVSVSPEAVVRLVGLVGLGRSMGLLFLAFGLGGAVGPPLAGWLADRSTGHDVPIGLAIGLVAVAVVASFTVRAPHLAQGGPQRSGGGR
jgi:predicted MFS family arabinose efflux permease